MDLGGSFSSHTIQTNVIGLLRMKRGIDQLLLLCSKRIQDQLVAFFRDIATHQVPVLHNLDPHVVNVPHQGFSSLRVTN